MNRAPSGIRVNRKPVVANWLRLKDGGNLPLVSDRPIDRQEGNTEIRAFGFCGLTENQNLNTTTLNVAEAGSIAAALKFENRTETVFAADTQAV